MAQKCEKWEKNRKKEKGFFLKTYTQMNIFSRKRLSEPHKSNVFSISNGCDRIIYMFVYILNTGSLTTSYFLI